MNPSYNGVGQQAPQNNPQQLAGGVGAGVGSANAGGISGGASIGGVAGISTRGVAGTTRSVSGVARRPVAGGANVGGVPGTGGGGQAFGQQPVISSGSGDIVLGGAAPEKKNRTAVIVLIVLVVLAVLAGGGFLLWQNLGGGGGELSEMRRDIALQEEYNSYVNYVLFGVDSSERPDFDESDVRVPYFSGLDGDERGTYLQKANSKYTDFYNDYEKYNIEKPDAGAMKAYFQDYAGIQVMTWEEIVASYVEEGRAETEKKIDESIATSSDDGYLQEYVSAVKKILKMYLAIVEDADKAGCIQDATLSMNCYGIEKIDERAYDNESSVTFNTTYSLTEAATNATGDIYAKLYGDFPEKWSGHKEGDQ